MSAEYLNNKRFTAAIEKYQTSEQEKIRYELFIDDMRNACENRKKYGVPPSHDLNTLYSEYNRVKNDYVNSKNELATAFQTLSQHLVRYAREIIIDPDDAVQEGIMICFEKVYRFKPEKGKAFNYMTTCILNHYRQLYRGHRNYKMLKERFKEFLASKFGNVIIKNGREIYSNDE